MNRLLILVTVKAIFAFANGHVAYSKTSNQLHPVHGLYVKPSIDGTTGDLYVAATEDSGMKTQWLADHPLHFLQMQHPAIPSSFNGEELNTQKRAVANPPMQYAYSLPTIQQASQPGKSEASALPYAYSLPTNPTLAQTEGKVEFPTAAAVPQYNPYQYFYPQMTAYANMMSILKDAGLTDETASSVISQASPVWPSYGYPYQYIMVDPTAWAQAQTAVSPVAPTTTSVPPAKESE